MNDTLKKAAQLFRVKEIDRDKKQIRFIMSTPAVDRHGEVVNQDGWDFKNFLQNPVVLWAHDHSEPAIGQVVILEKVNGNTEGVVQFAYEENEKAKTIFELCAGEYIRACSVGFRNLKWQYDEENDILTLLENELFELSIVNIPANAEALAKMKSKGLDAAFIMDEGMPREDKFKGLGVQVPVAKSADDGDEEPPAPVKTDEETTPTADQAKSALEVLCNSEIDIIKDAVKELTSRLNASTQVDIKDTPVDRTPAKGHAKRYSNADINRVIRSLLNGKEKKRVA